MIIEKSTPAILLELLRLGLIQHRIPAELVYIIIQYSATLSARYTPEVELTHIITRYHQLNDGGLSFAQALFKGLFTDHIDSSQTRTTIIQFYRQLIFQSLRRGLSRPESIEM